jgi:hypothetical protein
MENLDTLELGAWIGKGQAFGLLNNRCLSAQAECLKQIRERRLHDSLGISWDTFCSEHLGISRSHADQVIRNLEQFGETYFRLSEIMQISPSAYKAIEPAIVTGEKIRIGGELLAITPENAPRIRRAVKAMRDELRETKELRPTCTSVTDLQMRLDACFSLIRRLRRGTTDACIQTGVAGLINYSIDKLKEIARED